MELKNIEIEIQTKENIVTTKLQLSHTKIQSESILKLLNTENEYFIEATYKVVDDEVILEFNKEGYYDFEYIKTLPKKDKLRFLSNMLRFFNIENSKLIPLIHPTNIVCDENLIPKILHRGILNNTSPYVFEKEELLKQIQCLCITLFEKKETFEQLYNGLLYVDKKTKFKEQIANAKNKEELQKILEEGYNATKIKEIKTKKFVNKNAYKSLQIMSYSFIVLTLILGTLTFFAYFKTIPTNTKYLNASTELHNKNYSKVIDILQKEKIEVMPISMKHALSIATINSTKSLNELQKTEIINNLPMNSEPLFFDFWIQFGRNKYEEAIDLAKKLNNAELTIIALVSESAYIEEEKTLSGEELNKKVEENKKEAEELAAKIEKQKKEGKVNE